MIRSGLVVPMPGRAGDHAVAECRYVVGDAREATRDRPDRAANQLPAGQAVRLAKRSRYRPGVTPTSEVKLARKVAGE
jgi:hypothetical protein